MINERRFDLRYIVFVALTAFVFLGLLLLPSMLDKGADYGTAAFAEETAVVNDSVNVSVYVPAISFVNDGGWQVFNVSIIAKSASGDPSPYDYISIYQGDSLCGRNASLSLSKTGFCVIRVVKKVDFDFDIVLTVSVSVKKTKQSKSSADVLYQNVSCVLRCA